MKKLLSYLWPQTTNFVSEHSGTLEVTWYNGKKLLDTQNANYSYGLLQKVLETGLSNIAINRVSSTLILGLGGGSVVHSLRNKLNYQKHIDAVELDKKIIAVAKDEFDISDSDRLKIHHQDALLFVENCSSTYDLIIVDLFIDDLVPKQFLTETFCNQLLRIASGYVLFNLGIQLSEDDPARQVVSFFRQHSGYYSTLLENVKGNNTLLLIERKT